MLPIYLESKGKLIALYSATKIQKLSCLELHIYTQPRSCVFGSICIFSLSFWGYLCQRTAYSHSQISLASPPFIYMSLMVL